MQNIRLVKGLAAIVIAGTLAGCGKNIPAASGGTVMKGYVQNIELASR